MDLNDYKIGSPLRLDVYDDGGKLIENEFTSRFEEAINANEAVIAAPIVEGVVYALRVGWTLAVYMQEGNNFYRFYARVTQRSNQDGRQIIRINRYGEIDVAQRRQYFRFKCSIPFRYRIIRNYKKDVKGAFIIGKTSDISGSGLSFNTNEMIEKNSLIECELDIEGKLIYLVGKIMRCIRNGSSDQDGYANEVGVLFSEIEEQNRELIIKFIFTEERRYRKTNIA